MARWRRGAWTAAVAMSLTLAQPAGAQPGRGPDKTRASPEAAEIQRLIIEGRSLQLEGKLPQAIVSVKDALGRAEKLGGEGAELARTCEGLLGILHYLTDDYGAAEAYLNRAKARKERAGHPEDGELAALLNALGLVYTEQGDFARAETTIKRAIAIWDKVYGAGSFQGSNGLANLAEVYLRTGNKKDAEALLLKALPIKEKALGSYHDDVRKILHSLGTLYMQVGDLQRADVFQERALAVSEAILPKNHPELAPVITNRAHYYSFRGDRARAEELYRRALAIIEGAYGRDDPRYATSLTHLASEIGARGKLEEAEASAAKAVDILKRRSGTGSPVYLQAVNALAIILIKKGDLVAAEARFLEALALAEARFGKGHPETASFHHDIGELVLKKGDLKGAEEHLKLAISLMESGDGASHPIYAQSLYYLSSVFVLQSRPKEAREALARGITARERFAEAALAAGSEEERRSLMENLTYETHAAIAMHAQLDEGDMDAARLSLTTILERKGRVLDTLAEALSTIRGSLSESDRALFDELTSVRASLSALAMRGRGEASVEEHQALMSELDAKKQRLEAQMSRGVSRAGERRRVSIEAVQEKIPEGAALVEIASYEPLPWAPEARKKGLGALRYVAYVLKKGGDLAWVDLGEAAPIDELSAKFLKALSKPSLDPKPDGRALHDKIMRPLREKLGGARKILMSPEGSLNLVPFGALVDEEGRYLVEELSFTYLTSGRDLLRRPSPGAPRPKGGEGAPLIMAHPDFGPLRPAAAAAGKGARGGEGADDGDDGAGRRSIDMRSILFKPIRGTEREARAIKEALPEARLLLGGDATEAALKSARRPAILHLATHGFFLPDQPRAKGSEQGPAPAKAQAQAQAQAKAQPRIENPLLRAGLALAGANERRSGKDDGVLTALEAAGLDLRGTKLVVLSACETGVGETKNGEGVYGLRRALVLAGAEAQALSLWRVDDQATSWLMAAYYKKLLAGGGRSEAMREVQLAMFANALTAHPYYWAAFIVVGDGSALDGREVEPTFAKVAPGPRGCGCAVPGTEPRSGLGLWAAAAALMAGAWARARARQRAQPGVGGGVSQRPGIQT
jgi:CHAT domain-containing protein/tetratricopeptide (TPR) repeat protein